MVIEGRIHSITSEATFNKLSRQTELKIVVNSPFDPARVSKELMHSPTHGYVFMTSDRNDLAKPTDAKAEIKKGDKIRYQFIRGKGGVKPEVSVWMKVLDVVGDMITAAGTHNEYGDYEFRVLRCQVVEHLPKKTKVREMVETDPGVPAENKELVIEATERHFAKVENGTIAALKKRIEEFNLT